MKVLISTPRQYHSIDLANELAKNGLNVYLLTLSSSKFANLFKRNKGKKVNPLVKLRGNLIVSFFWYIKTFNVRFLYFLFDFITIINLLILRPKVLIVWSGFTIYSLKLAKYLNIKVLVERGSTHIQAQKDILQSLGEEAIPEWLVLREVLNYKLCDFIIIPSDFVLNSFTSESYKCKLIPYGVNPLPLNYTSANIKTLDAQEIFILYVGAYSVRKGIDRINDFLMECSKKFKVVNFVHIGDTNQCSIHVDGITVHELGFVPELLIPDLICKFKFHLAIQLSYEEGLSRVLGEYLRFGIPIIATRSTGIDGLKYCKPLIYENSIQCLDNLVQNFSKHVEDAEFSKSNIEKMSWNVYGVTYTEFLKEICD